MASLSIGKVRGLQQLADPGGIFAMCAMDHRGSMQQMLSPQAPQRAGYQALTEAKQDLAEMLSPVSTAVLLDPIYGAPQAIASGALRGSAGLLVSLEETGYGQEAEGRVTRLLDGWSVQKIKRMGASAVKILLYYRPDLPEVSARQRDVVRAVAGDCRTFDLPFVLEPIAYPVEAERDPAVFAARKPDLVVQSARDLTPLGVDVLKAQFPVELRFEHDTGRIREACARIDAASQVPWVLLSGGVSYDEFITQVETACRAGASGFLGGRAVWEQALKLPDRGERRRWLQTVGADRMRRLHEVAGGYGRPWWRKYGDSLRERVPVDELWYRRYGSE